MLLDKEFTQLESYIPQMDLSSAGVSKVAVGWHLDHMLRVIKTTCTSLKTSNPEDYHWQPNSTRSYVLAKGSFSRGVARAPKSVVATGEILMPELYDQLKQVKLLVSEIGSLHPESSFAHIYFGLINLEESQQFLEIHTRHHLKIIEDIIKAAESQ